MNGNARFEKLLEPGRIGSVKTKNRLIKSAAQISLCNETEPYMNEPTKSYYEAIAKGGVGLLIMESPIVDYPLGTRTNRRLRINEDKNIKELSELTQVTHKHGCPTFIQFYHDGPWEVTPSAWTKDFLGTKPLFPGSPKAASAVSFKEDLDKHNEMPVPLTIPEIQEIVEKFVSAAVRAQKAGFDGVDINAGSSHILNNFLSPFFNKRNDAYGGSLENRARIVTDIVREIKKRLGADFPVIVIINGIEIGQIIGVKNSQCLTLQDSLDIARILQEAGVDAIQPRSNWLGRHVAGYLPEHLCYPEPPIPLESFPQEYDVSRWGIGANLRVAEAMKKAVTIPIITVGRLDPTLGEEVLREGKADFIAMTRRLTADPELPNKVASGRLDDITPCTGCCVCTLSPKRCMVNAAVGKEYEYEIKQAEKQKKVLIVGGGPAGLEAARVAALRGHDVALYEKANQLGGLIPLAAVVKGLEFEDLLSLNRYLETQIEKAGVKTKLGQEVDVSTLEEIKPDVVILATGGIPTTPEIAGINNPIVIQTSVLYRRLKFYLRLLGPKTLARLTKFWMPIGKRVVVIGGRIHGCELAEFLVKRGRKVTVVDTGEAETLGAGIVAFRKLQLLSWFNKKGVTMMTQVKYVEITDKGLTVITREGKKETIEADSIIPAMPLTPNTELIKSFKGKAKEVYAIGDCKEPELVVGAIAEGSRIARAI
jgi:2,4-dienoyl-CoA reductase (NADPH2)